MNDNLLLILDEIIRRNRIALQKNIEKRRTEMEQDNTDHLKLYELLGFSAEEGQKIDLYQNIGRFVYKYVGTLIENTTIAVLQNTKQGQSIRLPNTVSTNPKTFQIDFYSTTDNKAHEIKWRDATTDGDHTRKERDKIKCIVEAGIVPVKLMYYMPSRAQAKRIQEKIIATYQEYGEAYTGRAAWNYIRDYTDFDLYAYLYQKTKGMDF